MAVFHLTEDRTNPKVVSINRNERGLDGLRAELADFYVQMRDFPGRDISLVLAEIAAMSARASEIRHWTIQGETRPEAAFRTKQLDPFLDEVDRQFKVWSRVQAVRAMEWDMTRAGV